jgi:16S rRNA (cytidine1402-2'-O)-methyltransferase
VLYVCATPIGNLDDVSPRLLAALRDAELIAAEDTRRTRRLLSRFELHTPLTSLFAHNEAEKTEKVLGLLRQGRDVALVSDAGTPGVSDPGARLVSRAAAEGVPLTVVPGPSAVTAAVAASGFASDAGFRFVGYLPRREKDLAEAIAAWRREGGLVVAFDSPRRLVRSLERLAAAAGDVPAVVCRELTKVHEEVVRGSLAQVAAELAARGEVRGELTLVLDLGEPTSSSATGGEARRAAAALLARGLSRRDAAAALRVCLGMPRREAERLAREAATSPPTAGRRPAGR